MLPTWLNWKKGCGPPSDFDRKRALDSIMTIREESEFLKNLLRVAVAYVMALAGIAEMIHNSQKNWHDNKNKK